MKWRNPFFLEQSVHYPKFEPIEFPLKDLYEKTNGTIEGLRDRDNDEIEDEEEDKGDGDDDQDDGDDGKT